MYMLAVTFYGLGDILDIPQQNPLKYGFNGIESTLSAAAVYDNYNDMQYYILGYAQ